MQEPVRKTTWDILVWNTRDLCFTFWEWPTFRQEWCQLKNSDLLEKDEGEGLCQILALGWEAISCAPVSYGFLWMNRAHVWTFRKQVTLTGTSNRETPRMPRSGVLDDDGYPDDGTS